MDVDIIICTHNRAKLLGQALRSLGMMAIPHGCALGVLVVDNASTDETAAEATRHLHAIRGARTKLVKEPRLGKSYAINRGVEEASGEIIVFVDDDHRVSEGFLAAIVRSVAEEPLCACFCGRILPDWDGSEPRWVHDQEKYPIRPFPIPTYDLGNTRVDVSRGGFLPGAGNLIVRKELFLRVGGFDPSLGPSGHNLSGGEDIDFVQRVLQQGEQIHYLPEAIQYHYVEPSRLRLGYLAKKAYLRSRVAQELTGTPIGRSIAGVPLYYVWQSLERLFKAVLTLDGSRRRFYLVRLAAVAGEIRGCRRRRSAR